MRTVWFHADKVALPIILLSSSSTGFVAWKLAEEEGAEVEETNGSREKIFKSQMDICFMF